MKLRYQLLVSIGLICIINDCFAQKNPAEYIVKDSSYTMGKVTPLGKGRIEFRTSKKAPPMVYNALEIKEYGYGGKVYQSLLINGSQRFLKKLTSGNLVLYQDKKSYALKRDTSLIVFNSTNYRSILREFLKCDGKEQSLAKISYAKNSLSHYVRDINRGRCDTGRFPHHKFGAYAGYNFLRFQSFFGNSINFEENIAVPAIGLFADLPLYRPRSLFVTTELNWFYGQPLFYREEQTNTNFSGVNVNALNVLISGKVFVTQSKVKTYFKAGALFSRMGITSPTGLVETIGNGSSVDVSRKEIAKSSTVLFGFNSGLGLEVPVGKRKNVHLECKYLKTGDRTFDTMSMNFSGFSIIAGFTI